MASDQLLDISFGAPEPRRSWWSRLVVVLGTLVLVAGVAVIARSGDDDDPEPDAAEDDAPTETGEVVVEIQSAGWADSLDPLRMPMIASPNDGLIDGQEISLTAAGFQPGVIVAAV